MRADAIAVGKHYAYDADGATYGALLRATAVSPPRSGKVEVDLHHPDPEVPDRRVTIATRSLLGPWAEVPQPGDAGYSHADWAPGSERWRPSMVDTRRKLSYADTAEGRWREVLDQRTRARRLTALGFERAERRYAGLPAETEEEIEARYARREAGLEPVPTTTTTFTIAEVEEILDGLEQIAARDMDAFDQRGTHP